MLADAAHRYGDAPALHQPSGDGYITLSWNQYLRAAYEIAAGLRSLGIVKGDVVALDSETRLEFYLADLGTMANGSIAAALYPSYPPHDLLRTIEASGARALFVENPKTLASASRRARAALDSAHRIGADGALTLEQLRAQGREALAGDPQLAARMAAELQPADPAILYLTSGATGEPKMALVTHQAIVSNLDMGPAVLPHRPAGFHRGVSALGAHRAARGDRAAAHPLPACR